MVNWVHNQIYKILEGKSKDTNVRFFVTQLLSRLRDLENKGALFFGDEGAAQDSKRPRRKFQPKVLNCSSA